MQFDNDYNSTVDAASQGGDTEEACDDQQEATLKWLLDQDYADSSDSLFGMPNERPTQVKLTPYEAEVANRPMTAGNKSADDLSSFLDEEIVMTSTGQGADIYDLSGGRNDSGLAEAEVDDWPVMAIDHTRKHGASDTQCPMHIDEGLDILGLRDEDDIGERYVVMQKPSVQAARVEAAAVEVATGDPAREENTGPDVDQGASAVDETTAVSSDTTERTLWLSDPQPLDAEAELVTGSFLETSENHNVESFDVFDYVAANEPPADDDDFDAYLLRGEHFEERDTTVQDLEVDKTDGIASVDPKVDTAIDYHEDFTATDEFNSASVTAITTVIADIMAQVSVSVAARLGDLGLDVDRVQVEVMLGTDSEAIAQCEEENFLPILEIAAAMPAALSRLGQTEIDTIYLRLLDSHSGDNWNGLFSEGFLNADSGASGDEEAAWLAEDDPLCTPVDASICEVDDSVQENPVGGELDDFDAPLGDIESLKQPDSAAEDEITAIFEEDIFADDLADEFGTGDDISGVDVEALIDSLADQETDIGEICGVAVDEFSGDAAADDFTATEETEQPVQAPETSPEKDLSWCIPADIRFSYSSKEEAEVFSDFLDAFIEEGASELEKLEDAMGEWEKDISSESAYAPVSRILHTLKGIAKGVGLQRYGTLIHNYETLLESYPRPFVGQESAYFAVVNAWLDTAVRGFEHIQSKRCDVASELPTVARSPVRERVAEPAVVDTALTSENVEPGSVEHPASAPATGEAQKKDKKLADEGAKVLASQQTIRMTPATVDRLLSLTNEAQQLGVRASQSSVKSKRAAAESLARLSQVRAHVAKIADKAFLNITAKGGEASSRLDALEMDQYSELQEAADILREGVEDLDDLIRLSNRQNTISESLLKQQASVISSMGSSIRATRVVPVSRLMPGLRRIVRNVSADLGKSATFKVLNEVGTLDRDNYVRCQTILEHMIRNALDHGIEHPQERVAAGKEATGRITIDASKRGSDYIVTLSDDGRGIDPDLMRDSAHDKGLDLDVDMLSDEEAVRLIFHKGFSTASKISEISGRGVGMDIVLSELQQIGGDIKIDSKVGVGTTFTVRIPSNVTVNGALLVAAGEVSYAIPLDGLIAVEHVPVAAFYEAIERGQCLSLFDMECEPAYLATICHGDSLPERSAWGASIPVIVAGSNKRCMAIAIDDVTQALELVIRSMGAQFSTIPGLAGAATTADGQSIVALDLNALVADVVSDGMSAVSMHAESDERMLVLVVDDSRTQRMVATSQFDNLGVETVTAENGLVAIDLLNTTHRIPDVVLLDIEMPVKDGIQTLREIRKSSRCSDIPVIMVTSRTGAKHRALAEEAGCNGYMGKPFNFPKLVEQIDSLTGRKFKLT